MITEEQVTFLTGNFDYALDDTYLWMSQMLQNALCRIDRTTHHVEPVAIFERYPIDAIFLYNAVLSYQGKLIFIPARADAIAVYDKKTNHLTYTTFMQHETRSNNPIGKAGFSFYHGAAYQDRVYLFGQDLGGIWLFYPDTGEIQTLKDTQDMHFCCEAVQLNGWFFIPERDTGRCLKLRPENGRIETLQSSTFTKHVLEITVHDGQIWLLTEKNAKLFLCVCDTDGQCKEAFEFPVHIGAEDIPFLKPIVTDTHIWLFPFCRKDIWCMHLATGKCKRWEEGEHLLSAPKKLLTPFRILNTRLLDGCILFQTGADFRWHLFDTLINKSDSFRTVIEEEKYTERYAETLYRKLSKNNGYATESNMNLSMFLLSVKGVITGG